MAVKYQNKFKSLAGVSWQIDIDDPDFSGEATVFTTESPGFSYSCPGDIDSRISGSEITIHWLVQSKTEWDFLIKTVYASELYYTVKIYRNTALWWIGKLYYNGQAFEDQYYPYRFDLKASDYLQMISGLPYDDYGTNYSGSVRILQHFQNILKKIETHHFYGENDIFIRTINNWIEDEMYNLETEGDDDPLWNTRLAHEAFLTYNDYNIVEPATCGDVLNELLTRFDLRLYMSEGAYVIAQTNLLSEKEYPVRLYTKELVYKDITTSITAHDSASLVSAGASTYFLPALRKVSHEYEYRQSLNPGNLLTPDFSLNLGYDLGEISGGSGERLNFNGTLRLTRIGDPVVKSIYAEFEFMVKLEAGTDYYYTNDGGALEWSTNSSKRLKLQTGELIDLDAMYNFSFDYPVVFNTLPIPATGTMTIEMKVNLYENDNTPYFDTDITSTPLNCVMIYIYGDGGTQEGKIRFEATNTNGAISINLLTEEYTGISGDGPRTFSVTRLQVWDGSQWVNSQFWQVRSDVIANEIGIYTLLCRESIARRRTPIPIYRAELEIDSSKTFAPLHVLSRPFFDPDGDQFDGVWLCLMADYDPTLDLANCEWMLLNINRENIDWSGAIVEYQNK